MQRLAAQFFPDGSAAVQKQVPLGAAALGQGHGPRIQVQVVLAKRYPGRYMGMAMEQHVPGLQGRQMFQVIVVAVGSKNQTATGFQKGIVCQDGKVQHQLVHLRVAIAPDAENMLPDAI